MGWLITIGVLVITSIVLLVIYWKQKFKYWSDRGVTTTPFKFGWGHVKNTVFHTEVFSLIASNMYFKLKSEGLKYFGFYFLHLPLFVPIDVEIVKSIMQNDFQHFVDRGIYFNEEDDPLSAHLFSLEGKKWKILRSKLTPTFTSGKMKMMFNTLVNCSKELDNVMQNNLDHCVDIKQTLNCFSMDVIGSCAFGIETNSLKNNGSEFLTKAKPLFQRSLRDSLKNILMFIEPKLMKFARLKVNHDDVSNFFMGVIKNTVEYREKNNVHRKDFMHLLIQLKNRGKLMDDDKLSGEILTEKENIITIEELAAQAFVFFEAGFETSSSTMAFCLFELGFNMEIQKKVRDEIRKVLAKYNGELRYEALAEMEYLDKCIHETLRKYPTLPTLNRICTKNYVVPGTDLLLEKGTKVLIPVYALHHDPEFYPDPEKFDPERFSEENKKDRLQFCYIPFGEGPRICIGMRFGLMQTKVGLLTILRKYEVKTNEKSIPMDFDPHNFTLCPKKTIWIDYKQI